MKSLILLCLLCSCAELPKTYKITTITYQCPVSYYYRDGLCYSAIPQEKVVIHKIVREVERKPKIKPKKHVKNDDCVKALAKVRECGVAI